MPSMLHLHEVVSGIDTVRQLRPDAFAVLAGTPNDSGMAYTSGAGEPTPAAAPPATAPAAGAGLLL